MRTFNKYKKNLKVVMSNGENFVKSYDTLVAKIDRGNNKLYQLGYWSMTTQKHINYAAYELGLELIGEDDKENIETNKPKQEDSFALGFMGAFLQLGQLTKFKNIEEEIKYKEKIVFSTMKFEIPNWQKPNDWNDISNEEKLERLNKIQTVNLNK